MCVAVLIELYTWYKNNVSDSCACPMHMHILTLHSRQQKYFLYRTLGKVSTKTQVSHLYAFSLYILVIRVPDPLDMCKCNSSYLSHQMSICNQYCCIMGLYLAGHHHFCNCKCALVVSFIVHPSTNVEFKIEEKHKLWIKLIYQS